MKRTDRKASEEKELTWWQMILLLALTLAVGLLLRNYVFNTYLVRGPSMQETLHDGEVMFVYRLGYQLGGDIERGDVITLRVPGDKHDLVKRVVALPGETISIRDGIVLINGEELEESYVTYRGHTVMGPLELKEDEYFVLGDNRTNSSDSRVFGPVKRENIRGEAKRILYPFKRWGDSLHG